MEQDQPVEVITSPVTMPAPTMTLCSYGSKLTREELAQVATPAGTATHKPIFHINVVEKLIVALSFRQIGVVREEYAVSSDGMKMFRRDRLESDLTAAVLLSVCATATTRAFG
jgi:hypothetical protein